MFIDIDGREIKSSSIIQHNMTQPVSLRKKTIGEVGLVGVSANFNNTTKSFDITLSFQINLSAAFKGELGSNNPGFERQVVGHEKGHIEQCIEYAQKLELSYNYMIGGTEKTYTGTADNILTEVSQDIIDNGIQRSLYPFCENVPISDELKKVQNDITSILKGHVNRKIAEDARTGNAENDANKRAERITGTKNKYGVINTKGDTNIKYKGKTLSVND